MLLLLAGLSILREIHHDPRLIGLVSGGLVSNPPKELANLRNSSLAHEGALALAAGKFVSLGGTGGGAAVSARTLPFAPRPAQASALNTTGQSRVTLSPR